MSDLAAEADWLVITGDDRIRHNPAWRRAWIQMGHTTFFLLAAWMKAPGETDCRVFAASGGLMQAAEMPAHCG